MARDLRVIFVKLADRIHNIQTLYFHPNPSKQQKIAQETMKIFSDKYDFQCVSDEIQISSPQVNTPASRAGKIVRFKHYQTDAPV